jgi:hypothetical protein
MELQLASEIDPHPKIPRQLSAHGIGRSGERTDLEPHLARQLNYSSRESAIFSGCREVTDFCMTKTTRRSVTETTHPTECDRNNTCKTRNVSVTARSQLGTALYTVEKKPLTPEQIHRNNAHRMCLFYAKTFVTSRFLGRGIIL